MLSIDGLVTGIDTASIIDGLLSIQQQQIDRLNLRKQGIIEQKTAIGVLESRLTALQGSLSQLSRTGSNAFSGRLVNVSDDSIINAATSNSALPGNYRVTVTSLARAHQVKSNSFASDQATIQTGTYGIQVGNGETIDVKVDDTNNTLDGLVSTINDSNAGVNAAVVNDGSGDNAFRVLVTAQETGASNAVSISFAADASSTDQTVAFDFDNPVQAATDSALRIGSGDGAIVVSSDTNQIDEVIPGVTLDLLKVDPDTEVEIDIRRDTEKAKTEVNTFIESFNGFMDFVDEQFRFNPESGETSSLFGNRSLIAIREELTRAVTTPVPGIDAQNNRLSAVGISLNENGRLQLSNSGFSDALSEDGPGLDGMQKLFGISGETSNRLAKFVLGSSDTAATSIDENGDAIPYQLRITNAAKRASILGDGDLAATISIDADNNQLDFKIDGSSELTVKLSNGEYTPEEIAAHVTAAINGLDGMRGREIAASVEDGKLKLRSEAFGSSSALEIIGGGALDPLGLVTANAKGQDVIGEYVFNAGVEGEEYIEQASGRGQLLVGQAETKGEEGATQDLQVRVTMQQSQVDPDTFVDVTFVRGVAAKLSDTIGNLLKTDGRLTRINEAFDGRVDSVDESIERLNNQFESRRESLVAQFARLESVVGDLQSTGSLLAAQLAAIPPINAG